VRALARREAARMASDRRYRSTAPTLRALASGDLHFDLPGFAPEDHVDEALLSRAGLLAARTLALQPAVTRERALRALVQRVARDVGIAGGDHGSADERRGVALLAPIVAGLPDIAAWPADDKAALAAMLRRKGAPQERGFAHAAAHAPAFFHALRAALRSSAG
jgi:hypothetical protein